MARMAAMLYNVDAFVGTSILQRERTWFSASANVAGVGVLGDGTTKAPAFRAAFSRADRKGAE